MAEIPELREWPQTRVEWRIKNFWDLPPELYISIASPRFFFSGSEWYISIYPDCDPDSEGWIGIFISREEQYKEDYVDCNIGIKNYDGTVLKVISEVNKFQNGELDWGSEKFIDKFTLCESDAVSPDGTLTIFCSVAIVEELFPEPSTEEVASERSSSFTTIETVEAESQTLYSDVEESLEPSTKEVASVRSSSFTTIETVEAASQILYSDDTSTLIRDLKDLYISSHQADLTITVKDKEFRAHRSILSCRSSVFKSMLLHDMMEKDSGSVEILDGDKDTFEDFLLFLYTGQFDYVSSRNVVSLYRYADKYDVQELKNECVRLMRNELSDDIFCDVLHLASMQNEQCLLKYVTDYFITNAKTISVTTQWQTFLEEHPLLGNELFVKLLYSKVNTGNE